MRNTRRWDSLMSRQLFWLWQSVLPWSGSDNGSFSLISALNTIEFWADINGCNDDPEINVLEDNGDPNISVKKRHYNSCSDSVEIILYEVSNGAHTWFKSPEIDATRVIVDFLFTHSKND